MATNKVIYSLTTGSGGVIFAATSDSGLFNTTNSGTNWNYINQFPPNSSAWDVYASGSTIFAELADNGIYRSTNNGINWVQVNAGLISFSPNEFIVKGQNVFASLWQDAVYRSSNNGIDWFTMSSGIPANSREFTDITVMGNNIFVSTIIEGANLVGGVYRSTNDGANWIAVNSGLPTPTTALFVYALEVLDTFLYAGTHAGVYRSTNMGASWTLSSQGITGNVQDFLVIETNIIAGSTTGFFISTNNGSTWTLFNQGLLNTNVLSLTADNTYVYAGTFGGSIFRRPLSEIIISSIQNISTEIPEKYNLNQNYPNPFNPITNIEFSIPKQGKVKITIYDSQGKEVASLLDQSLTAGTYKVDFDGTNFSSGIYFYKLETKNFIQTKSMVLLK